MNPKDIHLIAQYCRAKLPLENANPVEEEFYTSLPLCVIDTVFSIGARYQSTQLTVRRFCEFFGLQECSRERYPDPSRQLSVSSLLEIYDRYGVEQMASRVYQNRQRTSTRNGILKAEAVWRVSQVLQQHCVETLQDVDRVLGEPRFEAGFMAIPGQTSGISLRYFYMLTGSDNYVKPDRMIARFLRSATNKEFSIEEMHQAVAGAAEVLAVETPGLTPRRLDHLIWNYQRQR